MPSMDDLVGSVVEHTKQLVSTRNAYSKLVGDKVDLSTIRATLSQADDDSVVQLGVITLDKLDGGQALIDDLASGAADSFMDSVDELFTAVKTLKGLTDNARKSKAAG